MYLYGRNNIYTSLKNLECAYVCIMACIDTYQYMGIHTNTGDYGRIHGSIDFMLRKTVQSCTLSGAAVFAL